MSAAERLLPEIEKCIGLEYRQAASRLREAIERCFGAEVEGFSSYRYYEGGDKLRGWICYPLAFGITERAIGTRDALLSDRPWSKHGLRVVSDEDVVWGRETMYALLGLFKAGFVDDASEKLLEICRRYSQGDSSPYVTETSPSYKQLSAESALFAGVVLQGLMGLDPRFSHLIARPRLPEAWSFVKVRNVRLLSRDLSVTVTRERKSRIVCCELDGREVHHGAFPDDGEIVIA